MFIIFDRKDIITSTKFKRINNNSDKITSTEYLQELIIIMIKYVYQFFK